MPKKLPTDILWDILFVAQMGLLLWEHGYQKGRDSKPVEDPVE